MPEELAYKLAGCCAPKPKDDIIGYFKEDGTIAVHRADCRSVQNLRAERLLNVTWREIEATKEEPIEGNQIDLAFAQLDETDYRILKHHEKFGLDYSMVVADALGLPMEAAYERHRKLRELGALERVEKRMIQYRKNIVKGKWMKRRNHTYYDLTPKGRAWIEMFESSKNAAEDVNKSDV
jgi:hypothetical protein